jgi:uncharacterized membrane protein
MKSIFTQKSLKNPFIYLVLFLLGFFMRILNLKEGLWLDEIWSMVISSPQNSINDIIDFCKTDTHPPLFDILLNLYLRLFGEVDYNGRILSLIIGCLGIPVTLYYAVKISKNWLVGFFTFTTITFSFFHIYYSGEGRFYTFLYLLSLVVICELYLFLQNKKKVNLLGYAIASVLIIYTHYYGAILLLVLSLVVLFLWLIKDIDFKTLLNIVIANVIVLIIYSPWIPFMFGRNKGSSWMSEPSLGTFFEYMYGYTGKNPVEFLFILISILFSIKLFRTNVKFYALMLGTILLGFIIPFIVSYLTLPMLHERYTIIYYPCFIMLCGNFLGETKLISIKIKIISFSAIIGSILINFFFINNFIDEGRSEPWKEVAQDLAKLNKEDKEKVYSIQSFHLNYYLKKQHLQESSPYFEVEHQESFWYLHTPYEKMLPSFEKNLMVLKRINYGNKFALTHYRRN